MSDFYDAIIAGGGLSGLLAAARLAIARPNGRFLILEKEPRIGGRLRSTNPSEDFYGYGLNSLSERLFDYWAQTVKAAMGGPDLGSVLDRRQTTMGILSGQRLSETMISGWFTPAGAKTLGGPTAAKGWAEVEDVCRQGASRGAVDDDDEDSLSKDSDQSKGHSKGKGAPNKNAEIRSQSFGHLWKSTRKVPAAIVLEHFANALGIPDVWGATPAALAERAAYHSGRLFSGDFDHGFHAMISAPWFQKAVTVLTKRRIIHASFENSQWSIQAEGVHCKGRFLVVAQPPWQALAWLPKNCWPVHVLHLANKTKPVSVVVLTEQILAPEVHTPDVILVPSEHVQIIQNTSEELCFQATIDHELSLQAPAVIKAVKALKRARKKLLQIHPGLMSETGHIALQPIAWAQSPSCSDRKWLDRFSKKPPASGNLAFVGDAYGESYDGDLNILSSMNHLLAAQSNMVPSE